MLEDTKGVKSEAVNQRRTYNTMAQKGQKNKQRYTKHYTENYRSTQGELGCS
jgi:hypothetical protein